MLHLELAAQAADQRALQPQRRVQAEEAEHAEQQQRHEDVDVVDPRVLVPVHRVAVRDERQERGVDLCPHGSCSRRRWPRGCPGASLERGSLAGRLWCGVWQSEHIAALWRRHARPTCRGSCRGTTCRARRGSCRSRSACARATRQWSARWMACASWQVLHTGPSLPSRHSAPCALSSHSFRMPLWQSPHISGLRLVRGARLRVGVPQDVVGAVAVGAGRRRVAQAGDEQRPGMHAGEVALQHLLVARAAVAHLVERRHRRVRIVAAHGRVNAAVAALAGLRLAALDPGVHAALERRDLVLVAVHADVERHRAELVARMLGRERADVALDAVDALVRPGLELGFVDGQRVAGVVLHLGIVVAAEALRVRDLLGIRRRCGGGIRGRGGLLCRSGGGCGQSQQQGREAEDGDDVAKVAGPEHA